MKTWLILLIAAIFGLYCDVRGAALVMDGDRRGWLIIACGSLIYGLGALLWIA